MDSMTVRGVLTLFRMGRWAYRNIKDAHANRRVKCISCATMIPLDMPTGECCDCLIARKFPAKKAHTLIDRQRACLECGKNCGFGGVVQEDGAMLCYGCDRQRFGNAWLKPGAVTITK